MMRITILATALILAVPCARSVAQQPAAAGASAVTAETCQPQPDCRMLYLDLRPAGPGFGILQQGSQGRPTAPGGIITQGRPAPSFNREAFGLPQTGATSR
jgi:hypothetical protein